MAKRTYTSGPPPSVGWRPTDGGGPDIRWWNGTYWSIGVPRTWNKYQAESAAGMQTARRTDEIQWAPRPRSWPAASHT